LAVSALCALFLAFTKDGSYRVDPAKSGITWHAPITSGEHYGTIRINSGYVTYAGGRITSGQFTIDMNTVKDLDLEREKQPAIEAHIRSEDFFEASRYPYATFRLTGLEPKANGEMMASGSLTIKDVTRPISFPVKIREANGHIYVDAAKVEINRKDFGVMIRNKGIKGKMEELVINDIFNIGFSIMLTPS